MKVRRAFLTIKLSQKTWLLLFGFLLGWFLYPLLAHAKTFEVVPSSPASSVVLEVPGGIVIEPVHAPVAPAFPEVGARALMERIALCESQNDPTAKNSRSSASGRFQFLKSSWEAYGRELWGSTEGKDIFSEKDNTELAYFVYEKYGTSPWESSRYCWG